MYKRLQDYIASLQQYNSKLHTDLSTVEDDLKRIEKEKASMTENLNNLKGQLTMCKVSFYFTRSISHYVRLYLYVSFFTPPLSIYSGAY